MSAPDPSSFRVGQGYDVHALVKGRKLILGGVEVPFAWGLDGHSDADVIAHAIGDALLGAATLGDLGAHFPPGDPEWAGADSMHLLQLIAERLRAEGWAIANVDATLLAQAPKIRPHVDAMRANIAAALSIALDTVSVKATTTEGLGFVGRQEGMAAMAVALLVRRSA